MTAPQQPTPPPPLMQRRIASSQELSRFRCGERELDSWVRSHAYRLDKNGRCRVVTFSLQGSQTPCGFYSVSMTQEAPGKLLRPDDRDAWKDGAPLMYLQYIGVQIGQQKRGIGGVMLVAALRRALDLNEIVPIHGVALRSMNERTTKLYESFAFRRAPDEDGQHPLMILPMLTAKDLFSPPANG